MTINTIRAIGQAILEMNSFDILNLTEVKAYTATAVFINSFNSTEIESHIYPNPIQNEYVISINKFNEASYGDTDII